MIFLDAFCDLSTLSNIQQSKSENDIVLNTIEQRSCLHHPSKNCNCL